MRNDTKSCRACFLKMAATNRSDLFKQLNVLCICLMLNFHAFNLNCSYLHVALTVCFNADILLQDSKVLFDLKLISNNRMGTKSIFKYQNNPHGLQFSKGIRISKYPKCYLRLVSSERVTY